MIKQGTYIVTLHISVFPEFRKRDREAAGKRTATDSRACAGRSGQRVSAVLGALRLAEVVRYDADGKLLERQNQLHSAGPQKDQREQSLNDPERIVHDSNRVYLWLVAATSSRDLITPGHWG